MLEFQTTQIDTVFNIMPKEVLTGDLPEDDGTVSFFARKISLCLLKLKVRSQIRKYVHFYF